LRTKILELTRGNKNKINQIFKLFDSSLDNYLSFEEFEKML